MAATVELDVSNGAGETITHAPANLNMGSVDSASLDPVANPVVAGNNTYEIWVKLHVTAMGGSSKIDALRIWRTGALGGSAVEVTNARETTYGGAATYATPIATNSTLATQTMPTATPTNPNLGIGGSLTGSLTATGFSDYLIRQIQTNAADVAGSTSTLHAQYDETA